MLSIIELLGWLLTYTAKARKPYTSCEIASFYQATEFSGDIYISFAEATFMLNISDTNSRCCGCLYFYFLQKGIIRMHYIKNQDGTEMLSSGADKKRRD